MKGKKFIAIISIVCILAVMLCVPAFATVTESDGDGYALYSGVKLPNIDSVWIDKETYPYAYILRITMPDGYKLLCTGTPLVARTDSSGSIYTNGPYISWEMAIGDSAWGYRGTGNGTFMMGSSAQYFWANSDLKDYNYVLKLAASTPIPLDGYNLIEWDGATTGLDSYYDSYYRLSSYIDPVNIDPANYFAVYGGIVTDTLTFSPVDGGAVWYLGFSDSNTAIVIGIDYGAVDDMGAPSAGIYALDPSGKGPTLIAYRTVEEPPEGGGDTPDEPQPPFGAAEIYHKLHLFLLTPQLK